MSVPQASRGCGGGGGRGEGVLPDLECRGSTVIYSRQGEGKITTSFNFEDEPQTSQFTKFLYSDPIIAIGADLSTKRISFFFSFISKK